MNNEIVYEIDGHNHLILKSKFNGLEVATVDGGDIEEILHKVRMYDEEYDTLFNQNKLMQQIAKDYEEKDRQITQLTNIIDKLEKKLIDICNTCYEDKETAKIEKWIKGLKGDEE